MASKMKRVPERAAPDRKLPPGGATTGIGSLPHRSVESALDASFSLAIPFLPHLPRIDPGEFMLPQALEGRRALATDSFFNRLGHDPRTHVKFQIAGPATLRTYGGVNADPTSLLLQCVEPLIAESGRFGARPIVFIDEPALAAASSNRNKAALTELERTLRELGRLGATTGIHCCGETDWSRILVLPADILSFDASLSLDSLLAEATRLEAFVRRGGRLALGVVSAAADASAIAHHRWKTNSGNPLLEGALFTPACGLANLEVAQADAVLARLGAFASEAARARS